MRGGVFILRHFLADLSVDSPKWRYPELRLRGLGFAEAYTQRLFSHGQGKDDRTLA
ncbi:MAG: hypothetical protein WCS99_08685 [Limisphaerales bacterium]